MSTRVVGIALALVALGCAALLIAFARGVGAVTDELDALESSGPRVALARDADLPAFGPADRIARLALSVDDDIEFRRALGLIEESRRFAHLPNDVLEIHAQAIASLQRLNGSPSARASRAAALVGALYVEDLAIDSDAAARYRQQATEAFQTAVRLDPTNEAAKLGLELVLSRSSRPPQRPSEEGEGVGITGAGESPPGSGY